MAVILINAAMFAGEMAAGHIGDSQALQADALDFFADAITYSLSLAVIGSALAVRARAALFKGFSLLLVGGWVVGSTLYHTLFLAEPQAHIMGWTGLLALAANVLSVLLLLPYRNGDANVRSVWLCSRNDMIGNIAVMAAALGVWGASGSPWPDLAVAALMGGLFLNSAVRIILQARRELRAG